VLVCQGRAAADGRIATGRFADPVATWPDPDEDGGSLHREVETNRLGDLGSAAQRAGAGDDERGQRRDHHE
jgi:hypothetical protein